MNQRKTVHDIQRGSTLRLKNEVWKVTELYDYKWNDGSTSKEYKIKNQYGTKLYLEIELNDNNETVCILWSDMKYRRSFFKQDKQQEQIKFEGKSYPKSIDFNGYTYTYFEESYGTCSYGFSKESVSALTYATKDRRNFICLEIWYDDGDSEKELAEGQVIAESDISEITEGKKTITDYGIIRGIGRNITWVIGIPFFILVLSMNQCNSSYSSDSNDPRYQNDSTYVNKSNRNYYRNRNSRGYGK